MAKGFKCGGGANPLNFKVVGNPQPETAKDNTIWVDTDEKITGWVFGAAQPETAEEGMVWIATGTASAAEFNALKKNGITVCPLSAKQYVGGAWVDKAAKSYQGGAWVDWINWLYNAGDLCEGTTGGWVTSGWSANGWGLKCTFNSDNMDMASASNAHYGGAATANKLDLRSYKTLNAAVKVGSGSLYLYAATKAGEVFNSATNVAAKISTSTESIHTISLSISTVDEAYVVFTINGNANVYKVWLE